VVGAPPQTGQAVRGSGGPPAGSQWMWTARPHRGQSSASATVAMT
jgi:hypothetical protein